MGDEEVVRRGGKWEGERGGEGRSHLNPRFVLAPLPNRQLGLARGVRVNHLRPCFKCADRSDPFTLRKGFKAPTHKSLDILSQLKSKYAGRLDQFSFQKTASDTV